MKNRPKAAKIPSYIKNRGIYLLALLANFILPSCQRTEMDFDLASEHNDHFLEKASELLRAGQLPDQSLLSHWRDLGAEGAVDEMIQDPAFSNMVLDFNLYFLGARPANLRPYSSMWGGTVFSELAYGHPNAIHSAQEVAANGNFFSLFEQTQPLYVRPMWRYEDETLGDEHLRSLFNQARVIFSEAPNQSLTEAKCTQLKELLVDDQIQSILLEARFQESISDALRLDYRQKVLRKCTGDLSHTEQTGESILTALTAIQSKINALYHYEATQNRTNYPQRYVRDIRDAASVLAELGFASNSFTREEHWRTYVNSSTNFNRKRARYVLDRYFCDDLTPVDLPNNLPHANSTHASDPACQSCHYRLDPMAGYFRNIGNRGRNRQGSSYIDFDDNAYFEDQAYEAYMNSWKNPDSESERVWNIGYIRDPARPDRNVYGSSLDDLFLVFQSAPEVRQCVVKRMAEYVFGKNQAVDGNWLTEVGSPLLHAEPQSSAVAFKQTLKAMILSRGFAASDPDPEQCYDRPTSGSSANSIPCRIAWIIDQSCKTCHSANNSARGLDLTTWIEGPDGRSVPKHLQRESDGSTRQLTRSESFERIKTRLSTQQSGLIMPPIFMAPDQRIAFLQYLSRDEVNP